MQAIVSRPPMLLGAALLGGAVTFAILASRNPSSPPPATAPESPAPAPVSSEGAAPSTPSELAETIFGAYHESVVSDFVARPSFGFTRVSPHPGFSPYLDSSFTRFDFTFIGNDPSVRKFQVDDAALEGRPLVFHMSEAYARREQERNAVMLQEVDPFQRAPLHDPRALFDKDLKPEVSLPTGGELALLARFESSTETMTELHPVPGGALGYGALRATAKCLQCHEKEEGALLGLFRYRFDHGGGSPFRDLAAR